MEWNKNILSNLRDPQIHQWDPSFDEYFKAYDTGVTKTYIFMNKIYLFYK